MRCPGLRKPGFRLWQDGSLQGPVTLRSLCTPANLLSLSPLPNSPTSDRMSLCLMLGQLWCLRTFAKICSRTDQRNKTPKIYTVG